MRQNLAKVRLLEHLGIAEGDESRTAVERYQAIHGLKVDGVMGAVTMRHVEHPRICGVPDRMRRSNDPICRWDNTNWNGESFDGEPRELLLTWHFLAGGFGRVEMATVNKAVEDALLQYPKICALRYERTDNQGDANVLMQAGRIDGPSGTLGWSELSCGKDRQLNQRYDSSEPWYWGSGRSEQGRISFQSTLTHEMGHANGLSHSSGNGKPQLMDAFLNPEIWELQQGYDTDQHVFRYGWPITNSPAPVQPENVARVSVMVGDLSGSAEVELN